jgi:hypothetical protein
MPAISDTSASATMIIRRRRDVDTSHCIIAEIRRISTHEKVFMILRLATTNENEGQSTDRSHSLGCDV